MRSIYETAGPGFKKLNRTLLSFLFSSFMLCQVIYPVSAHESLSKQNVKLSLSDKPNYPALPAQCCYPRSYQSSIKLRGYKIRNCGLGKPSREAISRPTVPGCIYFQYVCSSKFLPLLGMDTTYPISYFHPNVLLL